MRGEGQGEDWMRWAGLGWLIVFLLSYVFISVPCFFELLSFLSFQMQKQRRFWCENHLNWAFLCYGYGCIPSMSWTSVV